MQSGLSTPQPAARSWTDWLRAGTQHPSVASLQHDVLVSVPHALTILGVGIATGILVYAPLGPDYVGAGAVAGVYGTIFGGACATILARSSAIFWTPQIVIGLVQASLAATLMAIPIFARNHGTAEIALIACVACAGLFQVAFGLTGLARIIKYTPHPVLAGFVNGVSVSILLSQLKPFVHVGDWLAGTGPLIGHRLVLAYAVAIVVFVFWLEARTKKMPAALAGLVLGLAAYHALRHLAPGLDLGPTLGRLPIAFPPPLPLTELASADTRAALLGALPSIVTVAAAIVVVGSFQSLLLFRVAENMTGNVFPGSRGLIALGAGNIVSAAVGGLAISVAVPQSIAALRSGGRTRTVGLTGCLLVFVLTFLTPGFLGTIPVALVVALLLVIALSVFDRWSIQQIRLFPQATAAERWRIAYDLTVVLVVMSVTVVTSIVPGILAGIAVSCLTFVMRMSRPIVRRRLSGTHTRPIGSARWHRRSSSARAATDGAC
jgi:SulP family sulfate permease